MQLIVEEAELRRMDPGPLDDPEREHWELVVHVSGEDFDWCVALWG